MKQNPSLPQGRFAALFISKNFVSLLGLWLLTPLLTFAQVPPVDPPSHFTTNNAATWEPGQLLFREIGLGRVAQAGYMNGSIYAGGYAGRPFKSWKWSDPSDASTLFVDLNEFNGDPIDWTITQGTHGFPNFGSQLAGGIRYVSPGVNNADAFNLNPEPGFGQRPKPAAAGSNDGAHSAHWPWLIPFNWPQYGSPEGYAWIYRGDTLVGEWDAAAETGIIGTTLLVGNLLFFLSDQTNSGVAVYDIGPLFDDDPTTGPQLLDKLSGSFGGYLPAVWENFIVLPTGVNGTNGLILIDYSDPTNLRFAGTLESALAQESGKDYVQFQDEYAFFHGNKVNMNTRATEVVMHGLDPENRPANSLSGALNTSQYNLPIGNLLLTAGYSTSGADGIGLWVHQDGPDTKRPYVGYHIPRQNQTNYPVGAPVTVLIHETLEMHTVVYGETVKLVRVSDDAVIPSYLSFSHDDHLMITPHDYLDANTEYRVDIIDNGLKDAAGNGVEGYSFNFSTGSTQPSGNAPPVIDAITVTGSPGEVNDSVQFNVQASDPEGSATLEYRFSPGDGDPATNWTTNALFSHTYGANGHYEAKVEVREQNATTNRTVDFATITISPEITGPRPTNSSPVAFDPVNDVVWVVNPDNDSITRLDADTQQVLSEIDLRGLLGLTESIDPRSVAVDSQGQAWIACHDANVVVVLGTNGGLIESIGMGYGSAPAGVAATPGGGQIYISTQAGGATDANNGTLRRYDAATRAITGEIELGPMARAIAISGDGNRVFVGRFISESISGEIWEVDGSQAATLPSAGTINLWPSAVDATSADGPGVPNYVSGLTISPDGQRLWYAAKKDNVQQGELFGADLLADSTVRAILGRIDLGTNQDVVGDRIDFDNADSPTAITFSPRGDWAFVTAQGNNLVGVFDVLKIQATGTAQSKSTHARWGVGFAPQGLVLDEGRGTLWVKNLTDRTITALDLQPFLSGGALNLTTQNITTVGSERLMASVLNGKKIFYNASDTDGANGVNRMSDEGYISCATCHVDGMHDGQTFDFTQRGEGLRNTTDLRGRAGLGHGNVHWTANFNEIHDFNLDIVNEFGGKGFPAEVTPNHPLGASNATGDADLNDLVAYITSLGTDSLPKSPYRDAASGSMTQEAQDGALLFNGSVTPVSGTALTCATCHNPDTEYTDSVLGDGLDSLHDVGTIRNISGNRLQGALNGIDTPTLLGVWNSAPYLHHGAAPTLDDVFVIASGQAYQAEDGVLTSANIETASGKAKGAYGLEAVRLQSGGSSVELQSVAGDGSLALIEIRFSAVKDISATIEINGVSEPVTFWQTRGDGNTATGWATMVLERPLDNNSTNSIQITKPSWQGGAKLHVDEILVANSADLAAANAHRQLLDVKNADPTEYDQVLAYIRQLDGRDMGGSLPGGGGGGDELLVNGDFSAGFAGRFGWSSPLDTTATDQGWFENPNNNRPIEIVNGQLTMTTGTSTPETVYQIIADEKTHTGDLTFSYDVLNVRSDLGWAIYGFNGSAASVDTALADDNFYTRSNLNLTPSNGVLLASGFFDTVGSGQTVSVDAGTGFDYLVIGINTPSSAANSTELLDNLSLKSSGGGVTVLAVDDTGITIDEGSNLPIDVLANDNGENLIISAANQGLLGQVTNNTLDVSYAPLTWTGSDTFTYTISDGLQSDMATVSVTINPVNGSNPVPAADLPLSLEFAVNAQANRQNTANGTWEVAASATGIDGSALGEDSLYMLADDTVTGDFQALVQLVSLNGPSGSRMGLMIRDGNGAGAEFISLGSAGSDGYVYQTRMNEGAQAESESAPSVGANHTFTTGKWVLFERIGNNLTVAVSGDDTVYSLHTSEDLSGWSETLHVGLYVFSGVGNQSAVAEFDHYAIGAPNLLLNGDFEQPFAGKLGFNTAISTSEGFGWYENPNGARPIEIQNGALGLSTGTSVTETVYQLIPSANGASGDLVFGYDVLTARPDFQWTLYGYNGTASQVDAALASDGLVTNSDLPSNPAQGDLLGTGVFDTVGTGLSSIINAGAGYDYLILGISTPSTSSSQVDLIDNLWLSTD